MHRRIKTTISLLSISVFLTLFKLWLISGQSFYALEKIWDDDLLFLRNAEFLFHGEWLGPYTKWTLTKGMFYPLWIAATYVAGVPTMFAQHILYIAACCILVLSVKPVLQKMILVFLLFAVVLFNPISYAEGVGTRVLREGIYPALTVLSLSAAIGLMVRRERRLRTLSVWSLGLGFALSAFWLTREEGIWMVMTILIILGFTAIKIYKARPFDWTRRLLFCILPIIILVASLLSVAMVNKIHYGIFSTNQFKQNSFLDAYGALTRVRHENWNPKIPVPREVREKIYRVVPSFAELRPFLEGPGPAGKGRIIDSCLGFSICNDIGGGWFMWALRDAVADAGYYKTGDSSDRYYKRLASEINLACDNKILDCGPTRSTLIPPWRIAYAWPLVTTFVDGALFLSKFTGTTASQKGFSLTQIDVLKIGILNVIGRIYQLIMPILVILAIVAYVITAVYVFREHALTDLYIINSAIVLAIAARLLIVSMIDISSFPAVNTLYLSPAYPLLLIFTIFSLMDCVKTIFHRSD